MNHMNSQIFPSNGHQCNGKEGKNEVMRRSSRRMYIDGELKASLTWLSRIGSQRWPPGTWQWLKGERGKWDKWKTKAWLVSGNGNALRRGKWCGDVLANNDSSYMLLRRVLSSMKCPLNTRRAHWVVSRIRRKLPWWKSRAVTNICEQERTWTQCIAFPWWAART